MACAIWSVSYTDINSPGSNKLCPFVSFSSLKINRISHCSNLKNAVSRPISLTASPLPLNSPYFYAHSSFCHYSSWSSLHLDARYSLAYIGEASAPPDSGESELQSTPERPCFFYQTDENYDKVQENIELTLKSWWCSTPPAKTRTWPTPHYPSATPHSSSHLKHTHSIFSQKLPQ